MGPELAFVSEISIKFSLCLTGSEGAMNPSLKKLLWLGKIQAQINGKTSCSWIGRLNIIKMSILLKIIYRFNVIPIKIPVAVFFRNRKIHPKTYIKSQVIPNSTNNLKNKNKVGGLTLLISKHIMKLQ